MNKLIRLSASSILFCMLLLIYYGSHNFSMSRKHMPADWWTERFLYQEIMEMSILGRSLFVYENVTKHEATTENVNKFKILVWKFGHWAKRKYVQGYTGPAKDFFANCSVRNCDYFYKDENILEADAVLFYLHPNWVSVKHVQEMVTLPRKSDQRWVYLSDESQWTSKLYPEYEGMFNWTMGFHIHNDVPTPLGRIVRRQDRVKGERARTDYHATKPLLVVALQSSCGGVSGRFDYLDQLVKHIQVDVWGGCGSRYNQSFSCPGWAQDCPGLNQYKFYIAFENSLCSEYFSEKLWVNGFRRYSVPVVMGGKSPRDYQKLLPPKSYINIEDFETPKDLADYLKFLDKNATEYNKYHVWREEYQALQEHGYYGTQASHYCRLCEALNYNSKEPKTYQSLQHFLGNDHCRKSFS